MSDAISASDDINPANDFFDLEDLNNDGLLRLLQNAYMDAEIVDDTIRVNEGRTCWVTPEVDAKRIWLARYTVFKPEAAEHDKFVYLNTINYDLPVVRAGISSKSGNLVIDFYIYVDGGITRRSIIYSIKHFLYFVDQALNLDKTNLLA